MKTWYRRKLPHLQPSEGTFFVTYRLFGSIPKAIIERLKGEHLLANQTIWDSIFKKKLLLEGREITDYGEKDRLFHLTKYNEEKRYFQQFDRFLDKSLNEPHWLKRPEFAALCANTLHFYANKSYDLWAFCIMSNHVHVLFTLQPGAPALCDVIGRIKSYSGKEGNAILGIHGIFWEEESYDHLVRPGEFDRILNYILQNPVKAGLTKEWQQYTWSYCNLQLLPGMEII